MSAWRTRKLTTAAVLERLKGCAEPRITTARPAGRSRGPAIVRFATDQLGVELLPWQSWALGAGCVWKDRRWQSRTVAILVGRQNGKTRLTTVRALAGMTLWGEDVVSAAQSRDVALEAWRDALELAEDAGLDVHTVRRTNGQETFSIGRARYKVLANTRAAGRGLSADLVVMDEVREYRTEEGWAALEKTRRARRSSQVWAITNEGDEGSVVLERLAREGRQAADSGARTDAAWLEWSAAPELARDDPEAWAQSNPALGWLVTADTIASECAHDDPLTFDTEVLCRRVVTLRPWLPAGAWDSCADAYASVPDGADVVFSLDAGPEGRHATIAVGWRRPDGRTFVEAVAGYDVDAGAVLPRAADRLRELADRWQPRAVLAVARSQSAAAAERALEGSSVPVVLVTGAQLAGAVNAFHEAVVARTLVHPPDAMTSDHVASVTSDGPLYRRSRSADVDAAAATVLARHGALTAPAPAAAQDWVAF